MNDSPTKFELTRRHNMYPTPAGEVAGRIFGAIIIVLVLSVAVMFLLRKLNPPATMGYDNVVLGSSAAEVITDGTDLMYKRLEPDTGPPLPAVVIVAVGETKTLEADLQRLVESGYTVKGAAGGIRGPRPERGRRGDCGCC